MKTGNIALRAIRAQLHLWLSGTGWRSGRFRSLLFPLLLVLVSVVLTIRCTCVVPTRNVGDECVSSEDCIDSGCFLGTCRIPCAEHEQCATKVCLRVRVETWFGREYSGGCQLATEKLCGEPRLLEHGLICNRDVYVNCEDQGCPLPDWCMDYACLPPAVRNEIYGRPTACEAWR